MNPGETYHDAIEDLRKRVEALESHIHSADELHEFTDPPILPVTNGTSGESAELVADTNSLESSDTLPSDDPKTADSESEVA